MMYYLDMASIVGKKQGGRTYYYLVESARVGGKPRIVSPRYLGSAEEITKRLSEFGPGEPDWTRRLGFGDLAAVVDAATPGCGRHRRRGCRVATLGRGLSVGTYLRWPSPTGSLPVRACT